MSSTVLVPLSETAKPESAETRTRLERLLSGASPGVRQALTSVCRAFEEPISDRVQFNEFSWLVSKMCDLDHKQLLTIRVFLKEYESDPSDETRSMVISAIGEVVTRSIWDGESVSVETPAEGNDVNDVRDARARLRKHRDFVAVQVKDLREERDLTQQDLAMLTGFSQSVISRIENGLYCNQRMTIKILAKALGVDAGIIDPSF